MLLKNKNIIQDKDKKDFQRDQVRILYEGLPSSISINLLLAAILSYVQRNLVSFQNLFMWMFLLGSILFVRIILYFIWRRHADDDFVFNKRMLLYFRLTTALTGLVWGWSGFVIFPSDNVPNQILHALVLSGISGGAASSLGIDLVSLFLFNGFTLGFVTIRFLMEGNEVLVSIAVMAFLYLIFTFIIAGRMHRTLLENILLKIKKIKSEDLILKNEERLKQAQQVSHTGSYEWNSVTGELNWSDEHFRLWGYEPGSVIPDYEVFTGRIHPDDVSYVKEILKRSMEGEGFYSCVHRVVHPGGNIRYIHGMGRVEFDSSGKPVFMNGTVQDITDQKHADEKFQAIHERFKKRTNSVPGVVYEFRIDLCGNFSFPYVSETAFNVLEINAADLIADSSLIFNKVFESDKQGMLESIETSRREFSKWDYEFRIKKNDGSIRWLYGNSLPDKNEDGSLSWFGFVTDITDKKNKDTELRIAAIAFDSQEGIVITDAAGKVIKCNHAFSNISGFNFEEIAGKTPGSVLKSGRHDREFFRNMWDKLIHEKYWQGEIWNRRKNGEIYPEWLTITAVSDSQGKTTHYVALIKDISEQKEKEEIIHHLAFYDPLTELPNRRLLIDRLKQLIISSDRNNRYAAILFIDLDNFKQLNDTMGHGAGDIMLIEVARRLKSCVREDDTVSRMGGDEFVILLSDLSSDYTDAELQADRIAEKIRSRIIEEYAIQNEKILSSPSIGICLFNDRSVDVEELFRRADNAMYQAKNSGKNTIRFYDPEEHSLLKIRMNIENGLRDALSSNQFRAYFQPQMSGEFLSGAEMLIRWEHPDRGLILPQGFIPIAEECGFIIHLDRWILRKACSTLKNWEASSSTKNLTLSVNISALQFHKNDFADFFKELLEETEINPHRLKLELTESTLLKDIFGSIQKIQTLKKHGVGLSMDDFGTGFSSLSYLSKLPIDQVKIDRSFVKNLGTNSKDDVIVETIIGMANSLGLDIIAEGVETDFQKKFLEDAGCFNFQGFYFGKPVPGDEFENLILNRKQL